MALTDWAEVFKLPPVSRAAAIEAAAREYLVSQDVPPDAPLTTHQLVQALCPVGSIPPALRTRFISALIDLAEKGLHDCAVRGEAELRKQFGFARYVRPWLWHAPPAARRYTCPNCSYNFDVV